MKVKIQDVQPGQVYERAHGLEKANNLFLKLYEQKVVNLSTMHLCRNVDQHEEVTVLKHSIDAYLVVGGILKG